MTEKTLSPLPATRRPGRPGVEFPEAFAAFLRLLRSSPEPRVTVRRLRAELGTGSHGKISEHLASCWARMAAMLEAGSPESLRRLPAPIADGFEHLYRLIEEGVRRELSGRPRDDVERAGEQNRLQTEKHRAAGLDKRNHELTVRVTELQQRLTDRERHLQMLSEQNDALTRLLSRAQTERGSLERRAEQLQRDLSELRERFETNLARLLRARPAAARSASKKPHSRNTRAPTGRFEPRRSVSRKRKGSHR